MTTPPLLFALSASALLACSSPADTSPDAAPIQTDAPALGCSAELQVERTRFVTESISYLRSAFATTDGFEGGAVGFGEAWVALTDATCPLADWSALSYVAPIDPSLVPDEMRGMYDRVAAVWSLNGRKFIAFIPNEGPAGDVAPWLYGRMPDNVNAIASAKADPRQLSALVAQLQQDPALTVTWLDAIGVLTVETTLGTFAFDEPAATTMPHIADAAFQIRTSGLFDTIEWSGFVVRIPNEVFPAARVNSDVIMPDCLRVHTRDMRTDGVFTTTPALAAPLGAGIVPRTPSCQ
ncbi:MAG: hypothetical protein JWP01_1398 [Myxococcales bacterium]|nr:hypothetical protein [Myxococcales bacterium]